MKYEQLSCTEEHLPLYESIAAMSRQENGGDFPIPDIEEGETGTLFLCKEGETLLGALSAVTYDLKQFYFSVWTSELDRHDIAEKLHAQMEEYIAELQKKQSREYAAKMQSEGSREYHAELQGEQEIELLCYLPDDDSARKQFLELNGYRMEEQEYYLEYSLSGNEMIPNNCDESISSVPETSVFRLRRLYREIFDVNGRAADAYVRMSLADEAIRFYRLRKGRTTIGMYGLIDNQSDCYLFSFGIRRKYRRRGLAEQSLTHICKMKRGQSQKLALQVNGQNAAALSLYRKFGFRTAQCMDLYRRRLEKDAAAKYEK